MYDFAKHYASLSDDELCRLASQTGDLADEARIALQEEMAKRKLDPGAKRDEATPVVARIEHDKDGKPRRGGFGRAALEILCFVSISIVLAILICSIFELNQEAARLLGQQSVPFALFLWAIYRFMSRLRYREIVVAATGITLLVIFLGPALSKHRERQGLLREWWEQVADLQRSKAPIARAIEDAYSEETKTWDAYKRRLDKLELVLPDWERHLALYEQMLSKFSQSPFAAGDEFRQMVSNGNTMLDLDREFVGLIGQEIAFGRGHLKLPGSERDKFWDENIAPLHRKQDDIKARQIEMVRRILPSTQN